MWSLKTISLLSGMFATLLIGGIGYGQLQGQVKSTKEDVIENKVDIRESQKINVEQTVTLTELVVTLKGVSKALDKVVEKLDN